MSRRCSRPSHGTDRDQRDQRDEQRVLEQVLTLFLTTEFTKFRSIDMFNPPRTSQRFPNELRRGVQLTRNAVEDGRDAVAGRGHRTNRDQRDQRDEQRVLEQVLALFVTHERTFTN